MRKIDRLRKETYNEAVALLKKYGKCAIIRPTGFGKTGILTKMIKQGGYKKILYLYPAQVVRNTVLNFYYGFGEHKDTIENVIFMTYMKLTNLSETDMKELSGVDLIICDECHRLGAAETMIGMRDLLEENPGVKLLGATATPARMDMIDEIAMFFDDRVTSKYTLHDAFTDGIIQRPYYCFCSYGASDPGALAGIKRDALLRTADIDPEDRPYAMELLDARMVEISKLSKMEYVIASTLDEVGVDVSYQKYIVFFSSFEHMRKAKKRVRKWFKNVFPGHTVNETIVSSEKAEYKENADILDSLRYRENTIDLIYACEMLNMGYHVADLTGIIMYRGTYSNIIYSQQLGRALSTGDQVPKIVFDIVDNLHRKSLYDLFTSESRQAAYFTEEERLEYIELVNKTNEKDKEGRPVHLTASEVNRLRELRKLMKKVDDEKLGKTNVNALYPEDLIVTKYEAQYRELIAKTVAEPVSMLCRQAWNRWLEKGGDASVMTRDYILGQVAPQAVPLPPFCRLKNVSVNAVLDEMGVA